MKEPELEGILKRHCESEAEVKKFVSFLETEPGQMRFKIHLREREAIPKAESKELSYLKEPTKTRAGRCYELAWKHITEQDEGTLIHGEVWSPKLGRMIDHAWVETETGYIYEPESDSYYPKDWLYKTYKVKEFNTYTPDQARIMGVRTGKYGPWTDAERKAFLKPSPSPSYLKDAVAETECQIISPQYYDVLRWLNIPVPDYSFAIEPEVKERKIDEVLQRLKDGVARIHESAVFREFLITMSKFHQYSIGNQILIMLQRPTATRVAGFYTWKDLGRYVKKGESGIAILAPCLPPKAEEIWVRGKAQWLVKKVPPVEREWGIYAVRSEDGVEIPQGVLVETFKTKWEAERKLREWGARRPEVELMPTYFKVVYVFDVSQTEGKPLPEFRVPILSGAVNEELFSKVLAHDKKQGLEVSFEPRPGQDPEIKGLYLAKTIWVRPEEPRAQQLKTLLHETAHYYTESVFGIPRADAETIAESVAFVVGVHFGFDTGVRSFPYVALWAKEREVLERNLASVRRVAISIMEGLERG